METSFIPLSAIIAILIIAFLFALRVRLFADVMLATLLLKMVTLANHRLHLLKLTLPYKLVVQKLIEQRLIDVEKVKARAKLQETEHKLSGVLYECGVILFDIYSLESQRKVLHLYKINQLGYGKIQQTSIDIYRASGIAEIQRNDCFR